MQSLNSRQIPDALHDDGNSPFTHGTDERGQLAIPQRYPYSNIDEHDFDSNEAFYESEGLPVEEKKEILVVTRNSIDILASILNSVPQQKHIKVLLLLYFHFCNVLESQEHIYYSNGVSLYCQGSTIVLGQVHLQIHTIKDAQNSSAHFLMYYVVQQ